MNRVWLDIKWGDMQKRHIRFNNDTSQCQSSNNTTILFYFVFFGSPPLQRSTYQQKKNINTVEHTLKAAILGYLRIRLTRGPPFLNSRFQTHTPVLGKGAIGADHDSEAVDCDSEGEEEEGTI